MIVRGELTIIDYNTPFDQGLIPLARSNSNSRNQNVIAVELGSR